MNKKITLLLILIFSCFALIKLGSGNQQTKLAKSYRYSSFDSMNKNFNSEVITAIERFAYESEMRNASIGFLVIDPTNNNIVCDYKSDLALIPASTLKLFTTATALEILGPDTSFTTWIQYDGVFDPEYKSLNGNIYIKGGGDPCLGSKAYHQRYYQPYFIEAWAKAIKELGIDVIDGDIIADELVFDTDIVPSGWNWIDIPAYYGSAASGLSIFDNTFTLEVQPSVRGKYLVPKQDINPYIPDFYVENHVNYSSNGAEYLDLIGTYYSNDRIIKGIVPKNKNGISIKGSIPDPPYLVAWNLKNELEKLGVKVSGIPTSMRQIRSDNKKSDGERKPITGISSPSLADIVKRTNLISNNLYAEHLLNHIGYMQKGKGSTTSGTDAVIAYWKTMGIETGGMSMGDGCGLSRSNTLTAKQLTHLLHFMRSSSENGELYYNSLPVSGVSGTLVRFGTTTTSKGKIHAKSGSMSRIKSYAGYLSCQSGNELIFAFIVNNFNGKSSDIRSKMASVLETVIKNN